jgi:hypothetical protein
VASEKLSYEIAALYSGQPAIKAAFDDFAKLNAQGAQVTRQLAAMGQQAANTGEQIRGSRTSFAQLGMQINQFGTQLASGTSIGTAFAQQIGDVGWALSQTGGTLGRVGSFLAGPWGAAIAIAASALGPLIDKLFDTSAATKKAEEAAKDMDRAIAARRSSEEDLRLALAKTAKEYLNIRREMQLTALMAVNTAKVELQARLAVLEGLMAKQKAMNAEIQKAASQGGSRAGAEMGTGQILERFQVDRETAKSITSVKEQVAILETLTGKLNASTINVVNATQRVTKENERGANATRDNAKETESKIDKEQNAYDRLAEKLRSILNIRTADTEAIGRAKNELADFDKLINDLMVATVNGVPVGAQLFGQLATQIAEVRKELVAATLDQQEYLVAIPGLSEAAEEAYKRQQDAIQAIGMSVNDAFKGMLTSGMSWRDGMKGIINAVIDQLWQLYVVQQIVGFVTSVIGKAFGGGGLKASDPLAKAFDATFGGGKAAGGAVYSNKAYLVGERGPEMFVPGSSGAIIPNHKTSNVGGAGGMVINVDARGSADPAAVRAQVQQGIIEAAPAIIAAAENRTIQNMRRPRLGGVIQ